MKNKKNYRIIDHTADTGIEVQGATCEELFENAARAFCDVLCDEKTVRPVVAKKVGLTRANNEELLQAFLSELLFYFEKDQLLFSAVHITFTNNHTLAATLKGESLVPGRHHVKTGIKAVTFHQLRVWREEMQWKARVIFDV